MSSHNAKTDFAFQNPSTEIVEETSEASEQRIPPAIDSNLTIDKDVDLGCDPYNATGQHIVVKPKITITD